MNPSRTRTRPPMPLVKALPLLVGGILAAEYVTLPLWTAAAVLVTACAGALLLRSQACLAAMIAAAGFFAAQIHAPARSVPLDVETFYRIEVGEFPVRRAGRIAAEGVVEAWQHPHDGSWHAARDRVLLRVDTLAGLEGGERLLCYAALRPLRGPEGYVRRMSRRGVAGMIWLTPRRLLEATPTEGGSLHRAAAGRLGRLPLAPGAEALCRAMAAGDKSRITPEMRARYARSGMAHLLAVSGLHTGMVFLLVNLALWWLPLLRRGHVVRNLLTVALVWLFVAAAGFPPSAVRAAVMCTLLQFSLAAGSEYASLNALAAAAAGMLLYNPAWIHDVGFRLSFIAVAGILAWGIPLCRLCRTRFRAINAVNDAFLVGLAATLSTAPLLSHTFGIVPVAGLVLGPPAIAAATVVVAVGACWMLVPLPGLAQAAGWTIDRAAGAVDYLAGLAASIPCGAVEYRLPAAPTAAIYLFFIVATWAARRCEPKKNVHLPA